MRDLFYALAIPIYGGSVVKWAYRGDLSAALAACACFTFAVVTWWKGREERV